MEHKRGDTFDYIAAIPLTKPDGYFAGFTLACQIRNLRGLVIAEVQAEWIDPVTTRLISLKCDADVTELWKPGPARMDIQFTRTADNYVQSTTTIDIEVVEDITRE